MKKYQYIVALSSVLVGAVGFSSIYLTNQAQERKDQLAKQQQILQEQQIDLAIKEKSNTNDKPEVVIPINPSKEIENEIMDDPLADVDIANQKQLEEQRLTEEETTVGNIVEEKLSFNPDNGVVWPVEGSVLLDYSMESTIFFPTLQQYQYNPAMILSGNVNDKVFFVAKGKITNIETNEVTGCTVTQDIGDGYTVIYGQLKELNFEVGDMVESGQVVGYISEPTKYYAVEGANVYFQVLKDGNPIDPEEILP